MRYPVGPYSLWCTQICPTPSPSPSKTQPHPTSTHTGRCPPPAPVPQTSASTKLSLKLRRFPPPPCWTLAHLHVHSCKTTPHPNKCSLPRTLPHSHSFPNRPPPHLSSFIQSWLPPLQGSHQGEAPSSTQDSASPKCSPLRTHPTHPCAPHVRHHPIRKRARPRKTATIPLPQCPKSFPHHKAPSWAQGAPPTTLSGHRHIPCTLAQDPTPPPHLITISAQDYPIQ
jgi:hypothetical protein